MLKPPENRIPKIKKSKKLVFYTITIFLSFFLGLFIVEAVLRNMSYTSNINIGNAAFHRWMAQHWQVNELGYRDILITPRLSSQKPKIYFVGDSFTAGGGVGFKDTYYFKTGIQLQDNYNFFNIARPGLSTLGELSEFHSFNTAINAKPDIVIHQYLGNDIEDYIPKFSWEAPNWLGFLSRHLESAQLFSIHLINQELVNVYRKSMLNAYQTPTILEKHENDLKILHQDIRNNGSTVIFLVFPPLTDENMRATTFITNEMRRFFSKTCQPNDIYIDATPAALSLDESTRVVSPLDQHPSPELHSLIADQIIKAILRESTEGQSHKAYETCENLRTAQAHARERRS